MAYSPIAFTAPNYRDYNNDWLKAYEPGTTTPKVMALEANGGTPVAMLQLNADGFIVSAGNALVMPYIDGSYDLWLFPTSTAAAANDTSNAVRLADNITGVADLVAQEGGLVPVSETVTLIDGQTLVIFTEQTTAGAEYHINGQDIDSRKLTSLDINTGLTTSTSITLYDSYPAGALVTLAKNSSTGVLNVSAGDIADLPEFIDSELINDLSQTYEFATVAEYKAFAATFPVGKVIHLLDRDAEFVVIAGTGTGNNNDIIASDQVSQSIDLANKNLSPNFYPQWGGDQLAFEAAVAANGNCDLLGQEVVLTSSYSMPPFSTIKNGTIKLGVGIDFRGDALCQMIGLTIDANGADYGIQEVITAGTTGMKEGLIDDVFIKNAAVSDVYLAGFHFLLKINRLLAFSSSSSWGVHIFNTGGTLNPDISITNSYIDDAANSKKGYNLQDGSYHLRSCSADNTIIPINANNAFITMDSCGFELFQQVSVISSSQLTMNQCTMSSRVGSYNDDGGNRAFILCSGGTIKGSVSLNGGIYQNNSDDIVYLVRGSSIALPESLKIGVDVEKRPLGNELRDFIYQSLGSPSIDVAKIAHLGDRNSSPVFAGKDPTGNTAFDIEVGKDAVEFIPQKSGTVRYITWREIGNTAGASTAVDFVVYNSDRTERFRQASVISVPGTTSGGVRRFGSKIIDEPIADDEYIQFEVSIAGGRVTTGFSITMTMDE